MRTARLGEDEITEGLSKLPEWTQAGQTILRTFTLGSFAAALAFVNKVAAAAEQADHHPDIDIRYSEVTLALTTHYLKGLTAKDFELAAVCDALAGEEQP